MEKWIAGGIRDPILEVGGILLIHRRAGYELYCRGAFHPFESTDKGRKYSYRPYTLARIFAAFLRCPDLYFK